MTLADRLREEGKIEGRQEGRIEGRTEGRAEGRIQGMRESILRALEIIHGGYPQGMREVVEGLDDPTELDRVYESAARSSSIEEFAQQL